MTLIDGWRHSWRLWSVRLSALGAALSTFALTCPDIVLGVWNSLPGDSRAALPAGLPMIVPTLLFVSATLARLLKQKAETDGK